MPQESRVKKTLLNARVNLIFYFLTLALSFFSRKIFLDCLGADFIGLTGTLQNLLGFLNLAELGIGSAIGYVLYKPLFDHDQEKINEIISVMGYLYRWIGFIILGGGCLLACFIPLIFPNTKFDLSIIYFAYFSFLASSLIGYFINYRQNLLGADQRNYVVTAYFQTSNIAKTLIQMASAYYTGSYYLWVAIELTFGIIYSFILNWKINQTYPWLRSDVRRGRQLFNQYPKVMKYTRQLFVHRISSFVQYQTTPFLIYSFVNLRQVALYGNYDLVVSKLGGIFSSITGSTSAGVGNLIAEGSKDRILSIFWQMYAINMYIASFCAFTTFKLINPFIVLWLGEEYLLSDLLVIMFLFRNVINGTRGTVDQFLYGYGLFYDTWAPIAEAVIFIALALVGGYYWGLEGIILASIISLLAIIGIWKPYFLFRSGFKLPQRIYWMNMLRYYLVSGISMYISSFIINFFVILQPSRYIKDWCIYAVYVSVTMIVVNLIMQTLTSNGMRNSLARIIKNDYHGSSK